MEISDVSPAVAHSIHIPEKPDAAGHTDQLSEEEQKKVAEMKKRDQEVRRHEQAHLAAAGSLASAGARFQYEVGPDGQRYAVAGSVKIDNSKVAGDPKATIAKAQKIKRAALAPADPSAADRQVAAKASQMEQKAQQELRAQEQEQEERAIYDKSGNSAALSPFHDGIDVSG